MSLAWGGYANGQIPVDKLVAVGVSPTLHVIQYLESGAARSFLAFDRAFYARFDKHIAPVEAYRSLARQRQLYADYLRDPVHEPLAATPGTSNHGYARAVDMGSGIASFGTAEAQWARANGPAYGLWPTGYGFAKTEPWHYDWRPGTATASLDITPLTIQEDDMPRYIRNSDTGTIAIGALGVFWVELPDPAYVTLLDGWKLWDRTQDLNLPDNIYQFAKSFSQRQNAGSIVTKIVEALTAKGNTVDAASVAQAVDAALADNFAALPAATVTAIKTAL